jgi:hypothetical protein
MHRLKNLIIWLAVVAALLISPNQNSIPITGGNKAEPDSGPYPLYLPMVLRGGSTVTPPTIPSTPPVATAIHVPFLDYTDVIGQRMAEMAIFWYGRITPVENYTDVRLGYNNNSLFVHAAVIDRLLWYDTTPSARDLTQYDAVTIYLDTAHSTANSPAASSYKIEMQASPEYANRLSYQAVYRWNGSSWGSISSTITTKSGWRSSTGGFNDSQEDRGWYVSAEIPFAALGLSGKPADFTLWKMAVVTHDRDTTADSPQPPKTWPANLDANSPASWKSISFRLPVYQPAAGTLAGSAAIRHGVNGAVVKDGSVGGNPNCGDGLDFWTVWGNTVYNGEQSKLEANIQNQRDLADWPCFSKYYITFPLDQVPAGKNILSADLTLYQFGNAGAWGVDQPPWRSLIQVFTVAEDINPETLNWNNAPLPLENVSRAWVEPLEVYPGWPGIARSFDLTRAVSAARQQNQPLRLAIYSADGAYHSGKYFRTSDVDGWAEAVNGRPVLDIRWADQ